MEILSYAGLVCVMGHVYARGGCLIDHYGSTGHRDATLGNSVENKGKETNADDSGDVTLGILGRQRVDYSFKGNGIRQQQRQVLELQARLGEVVDHADALDDFLAHLIGNPAVRIHHKLQPWGGRLAQTLVAAHTSCSLRSPPALLRSRSDRTNTNAAVMKRTKPRYVGRIISKKKRFHDSVGESL
jgi:hypothetical protein